MPADRVILRATTSAAESASFFAPALDVPLAPEVTVSIVRGAFREKPVNEDQNHDDEE